MSIETDLRPGEIAAAGAPRADAALTFIGRIRTPWTSRADCPKQGDAVDGPVCRVEVDPPWDRALDGIEATETLDLLYWLDRSRRDLLVQVPHGGMPRGTFALRSPVRPNPIGLSRVRLVGREGAVLLVRGLDCLDGTPLVDLKPARCAHSAGA